MIHCMYDYSKYGSVDHHPWLAAVMVVLWPVAVIAVLWFADAVLHVVAPVLF